MSARPAALPMYRWPAVARQLTRRHLQASVPARWHWGPPGELHHHWLRPDLLLSQTCAWPLVTEQVGRVTLLGAFVYDVPGCREIDYSSWIVVRQQDPARHLADLAGRVALCNDPRSQSGHHALRAAVAAAGLAGPFFGGWQVSGAHLQSIRLLKAGQGDVAAIDCVTWALLQRSRPALLQGLRIIGQTPHCPGLPLITSRHTDHDTVLQLQAALDRLTDAPRAAILRRHAFVCGFVRADWQDYARCLALAAESDAAGVLSARAVGASAHSAR